MAQFINAIGLVLQHEGGFVNDAADPGGATNYGISLYLLQHLGHIDGELQGDLNHDGRVDIEDIKALTPEIAAQYYRELWWDKYGYERIISDDVAARLFDMAVNMGGVQAHKLIQRAVNHCGELVACDGGLGPVTITAINSVPARQLLAEFSIQCAEFYKGLAVRKPTLGKFLAGWLNRAADIIRQPAVAEVPA